MTANPVLAVAVVVAVFLPIGYYGTRRRRWSRDRVVRAVENRFRGARCVHFNIEVHPIAPEEIIRIGADRGYAYAGAAAGVMAFRRRGAPSDTEHGILEQHGWRIRGRP
ncbi:hypothetical protein [Streptomyces sp. SID3343]|uniref:hypothetical protein n=1 Tax=Streptomyces sp. SID3343 TaxID=2690260 RepID=UPI00136A711F|nr:hypothetical protein [Streptomyces sp. SID3343]MYV97100.1 hypothetical protein [Streptomyces sp. SID3343]